jgi:transposase
LRPARVCRDEPYRDLGPDWLARRNDEAHTRRLVAQLERLGHTVILDPAA